MPGSVASVSSVIEKTQITGYFQTSKCITCCKRISSQQYAQASSSVPTITSSSRNGRNDTVP